MKKLFLHLLFLTFGVSLIEADPATASYVGLWQSYVAVDSSLSYASQDLGIKEAPTINGYWFVSLSIDSNLNVTLSKYSLDPSFARKATEEKLFKANIEDDHLLCRLSSDPNAPVYFELHFRDGHLITQTDVNHWLQFSQSYNRDFLRIKSIAHLIETSNDADAMGCVFKPTAEIKWHKEDVAEALTIAKGK